MSYISTFFLARTPLLPYNTSFRIFRESNDLPKILAEYYSNPILQEAIYLASRVLYTEMKKYLANEIRDNKKVEKIEITLVEYLLRASTRSTPFGLFAGCSVGSFGDENKIDLKSIYHRSGLEKHLRLDMGVQVHISDFFTANSIFRKSVKYYPNSSIFRQGKKLKYAEFRTSNGRRNYNLTEVEYFPIIGKILSLVRKGAYHAEILDLLIKSGFEIEESESFIEELINNQIIISEAEPSVNGPDYFTNLSEMIERLELEKPNRTRKIKDLLNCSSRELNSIESYKKIELELEHYNIPDKSKVNTFQVDLNRNTHIATLSNKLKNDLLSGVKVLCALNQYSNSDSSLEKFKIAFRERYDERAVSLTEALDIETGINYKNLDMYSKSLNRIDFNKNINELKTHKYHSFLKEGLEEINITNEDISKFNIDLNKGFFQSFSVLVNILDKNGDRIQINGVTGGSFTNLLGRFCNSNSELKSEVLSMLQTENQVNEEKVIAEIVHLPQSRLGNILNRPHLSAYEIPYLGKSTLPIDKQLHVSDLYIKLNGNELVLFSKKIGKQIIPRLSSAHNFSVNSLPIYRFLCDLQFQGIRTGGTWSWGALESENFLPRVRFGNIILSPAKWKVSLKSINSKELNKDLRILENGLIKKLNDIKIPRFVHYVIGDNKLLIDTQSSFGRRYLTKKLSKEKVLYLNECLFDDNELLVQSPDGGYSNEIVVPFLNSTKRNDYKLNISKESVGVEREFAPGSKWVYYKLYLGIKTSNRFLSEVIFPFAMKAVKSGKIDKWFFIRYVDPQPHLRIRFELKDISYIGDLTSDFYRLIKFYIKDKTISKVQIDTYIREIERYGPKTMELSEQHFYLNSNLICGVYQKLDWNDVETKFQIAFKVIECMLETVLSIDAERLRFLGLALQGFGFKQEMLSKDLRENVNKKYRVFSSKKPAFDKLIDDAPFFDSEIRKHNEFFSKNLVRFNRLKEERDMFRIYRSYIHMFVNRLFDWAQVDIEKELYYCLERYYLSIEARNNTSQKGKKELS